MLEIIEFYKQLLQHFYIAFNVSIDEFNQVFYFS
jgi:hypothetical protein